jgi:hypothetical protein
MFSMRPASHSILRAVERTEHSHEDRLTEVLACVAQVNSDFADALVRMVGLDPYPGERYAIGTQRGTPGGRRVDMEIATYDGLARTKLIWVEAKDGAVYQPDQLSDYAKEVRHPVFGEPDGRVLTIIPPGMGPEPDTTPGSAQWETKTWSDIALAAERLGREWGRDSGRRWPHDAMKPQAPAQWRYLAELVQRLEEKGYARMQPLTPEDVIAAHRHMSLPSTIEDMVKVAAQSIDGVTPVKHRGIRRGRYHTFAPIEEKWFSDSERFGHAYPELLYYHDEDWTPERLGAPAFCAGITFAEPSEVTHHVLSDETWQASLPDAGLPGGVKIGGSRKLLRVVRTKYLSELVVAGATFDEQARALGLWANVAITELMDKVPAPPPQLGSPSGVHCDGQDWNAE